MLQSISGLIVTVFSWKYEFKKGEAVAIFHLDFSKDLLNRRFEIADDI